MESVVLQTSSVILYPPFFSVVYANFCKRRLLRLFFKGAGAFATVLLSKFLIRSFLIHLTCVVFAEDKSKKLYALETSLIITR